MPEWYTLLSWEDESMPLTMKSRYLLFGGLCLLALLLNGCGDDSETSDESYDKALYMAYATSNPSETMYSITVSDLMLIIDDLQDMVYDYYVAKGNIPASVDLSNPPSGWDTVPSGMTGTLIFNESSFQVTANLTLSGCAISSRTYTGTFKGQGYINPSTLAFATISITATNLEVAYSGTDNVKFKSYVLGIDNTGSYPTYSFNGSLTYGGSGYGYDNFMITQSSTTAKTVSGTLLFNGYYFGVSGSVTVSSGYWTGGTLKITSQDSDGNVEETATVTLDGTTASFAIEGGDSWDVEDWYSEQLVP